MKYISEIVKADKSAINAAKARQMILAKPPGSLGKLEDISVKMAGITGSVINDIGQGCVLVFAADHGVTEEGIASAPKSVTLSQSINMTQSKTGMSSLAHYYGERVRVYDVGIDADYECEAIINKKIRYGTANIAKEPAMTKDECIRAIFAGIEAAESACRDGVEIIGIGEMGIGNTTASAAVLSLITGVSAEDVTGRGGGLTDEAYKRKIEVVKRVVGLHKPFCNDITDILTRAGGLEIASMCGAYLACAKMRVPAVVDGFISAVAALCAVKLCENVRDFIFMSHLSDEKGYKVASDELGLKAFLDLSMRLGEGSGCVIAFSVIRAACAVMRDMATFSQAGINEEYLDEIRKMER